MNDHNEALALVHDETSITRVETSAVAVLARSELEAQMDCAHKYPRSIKAFVNEAIGLATLTREIAESCVYALPRAGKTIAGPSVRLAEIMASAYGNIHVAARVLDAEEREVVAQGVCWDIQKNVRVTVEARRRITNKAGKRYDDDMIGVTGAAAGSIALRNAIFRVVPRAYVDMVYAKVKEVAVGNASTLAGRREEVIVRLMKIGVPQERVFARLGKKAIEDVGLEDVEMLIGLGTAIKKNDVSIDVAFPPVGGGTSATKDLEAELTKVKPPEPKAETPKAPESKPAEPTSEPASVKAEVVAHDADGVVVESPLPLPTWATAPVDPLHDKKAKAAAAPKKAREPGED